MLADVKKFMNHELENMDLNLIRLGWGSTNQVRDDELLNEICDLFNKRIETEILAREESEWNDIMRIQRDVIDALKNRNLTISMKV